MAANVKTHERVVAIVIDQLGIDAKAVKPESRFIEDLGADSLDTVELVMAVEEEFDVAVPDEVAEKLRTVGELVKWLEKPPVEVE
ncbi:MAG TPA: acyl carrier protein [Haloferula sp.]